MQLQPRAAHLPRGTEDWAPAQRLPEPSPASARLREIGRVLKRRARLIVGTVLILNLVAVALIHQLTPRYTAEASLIIDPRQPNVLDLNTVMSKLSGDREALESEIQLLTSRSLARSVVERLRLDENPEFNPQLRAPGLLAQLKEQLGGRLAGWLPALVARAPQAPAAPEAVADPLADAVNTFLRRLSVEPKGRSRVLEIAFESADPVLAAQAANAVADAYIADHLRTKLEGTDHAQKWLAELVTQFRQQVIKSDQAAESYRRQAGISEGRSGPLLSEQMSTLGEQIVQADLSLANASARLRAATASSQNLEGLPEFQGSVVLQGLRAQESALKQEAAELSRIYGVRHPKIAANRAALDDVEERIRAEVAKVTEGLRAEVRAAEARKTTLQDNLTALQKQVSTGNEGEIELRALVHEAEANRTLYDRLLARYLETNVEGGLQQPDAQVVSYAEPPTTPSFPQPLLMLPLFFVASFIVALLLAFGLENLDHGFATLEDVEESLGFAAIGVVPRVRRQRGDRGSPDTYILNQSISVFGEAIRNLHTSLMLSDVDRPPKTILLASSLPGEGKSTVALSLARLMASCGKRVALVDCDLRRPDLHKAFGASQAPGLIDCLSGQAEVLDVLRTDRLTPACLVPAGSPAHTSPDLFASGNMRKLIADLSARFDLVILDSGPVLAVSDTRNLCRLVDKTVFVVRWQDTRRHAVRLALRQIIEAGGNIAGVLLSMVDFQRYARYSDTGFYQRKLQLYLPE